MKKILALILFSAIAQVQAGEAKVEYVGLGRYTCSGDAYKCAQIDRNNREREERDRWNYEREQERNRQEMRDMERRNDSTQDRRSRY